VTGLTKTAARFLTYVAALCLLGMVAINVVDVLLRSTINAPIFGTYEIVELMLAAVAFLAIPSAFLAKEHVTVDLTDRLLPPRAVRVLKVTGHALAFGFLALLAYAMIWPAMDFVAYGEVTLDLHLPLIWRGSFVLLGIFASALAAGIVLWQEMRPRAARHCRVKDSPAVPDPGARAEGVR
jgi:TRAP-type C4-dicarboxylate transport system permease small subunit